MTERGNYGYIPRQVLSRSQYNEFHRRMELAFTWLCSQLDEIDCHGLANEVNQILYVLKGGGNLSQICSANCTVAFVSGQVYCNVCEQLFGLSIARRERSVFDEILNFLLDRGSHFPVSFSLSALTFSPLHQASHCAMIEAIMNVHIRTLLTCEQISCSRYEVLSDPKLILSWNHIETVILYWMNEITNRVNKILRSQPAVTKSCFNSRQSLNTSFETLGFNGKGGQNNCLQIPEIEDAAQGISDGQTLLAVLSYHFPNLIPLKAGKFYPLMSFSDCVHNLSLVCDFCSSESYTQNCSNVQPWLLTVEDLLYPNLSLRVHVLNALVQLYLALKAVPEQETLLYHSSQSLKSNSEDSIGSHEGETDSLNGYNFTQNLRSQSMHSFSRPQAQASMDPAGDALMELESRWKQQKSSRPSLISPSPSSQMSFGSATNSEVNLNVGRDKSPRRVQEGRDGLTKKRDKGSITPKKEDRKPRIPSEDSALGTSSSPSEVSTKTSFSTKKVNNQNNAQLIRPEPTEETSLQVDSGGKTYSRRSARPQSQRLSVHELTQAYENELRPLSAMKQGQESPSNLKVQNNDAKPSEGKSTSNFTSFGSQSNLRARTEGKKRPVSRPKSAMDERFFSLSNQNDENSAEDVNSDPEISMATSGLSKRFDDGAQMSSSAKMSAIKMKMEERRKCIQMERARAEAVKNKQRQTLGKTAFMRVIKGNNGSNTQIESDDCRSTADESEFSVGDFSPEKPQVVMRRHKTSEDRQSFANRRQRAKSSNLDAVNLQYNSNQDFENFSNDSVASSRRVSAEVQTSVNLDDQRSASAMHTRSQRARPVSNYIERDELESFTSSGIGSNQSTLRRTKALGRPSTAYGDIFQRNENEKMDFGAGEGGDIVTSSVDLRSSLERDMLIEQNQILARELQTLKHKFAVELETRKLQSEQFEMQRKAEQSLQRSRTDLSGYPSQVYAPQNNARIPPSWNHASQNMVPNDRLPPVSTSVMNHNQVNTLTMHQSLNRHQSNPPFSHASMQNPGSSMYPNYGNQSFPVHHHQGNQNFQLASSRPQSMYAMQGLQPPYAVHDNEAYHNFETTHNQEYHYETLHGSHHNYYHQQPPPVSNQNPYAQPPTSVYQHPAYNQVSVHNQSNLAENQQNMSNDGQFARSRSNSALSSNLNTSPRQIYDVTSNDIANNPNANVAKPKAKRPQTLDMGSEKRHVKSSEKKQSEGTSVNRQTEKERATAYDSSSAISPLDPDIRISSSVEVTPENSPVHQNRPLASDQKTRSPQNPNSRIVQYNDSGDGMLNTSNSNGASNPYHQKETSTREKSSISPNPVFDDPPSQPSTQVNQPKKAEAFSVNFFNSQPTNSGSQPPPLKSNRFSNPQKRSNSSKALSANVQPSSNSNNPKQDKESGIGSNSNVSGRRVTSAPAVNKGMGQPNREDFSTPSSTTVDEALKIVQEGDLSSSIDLGRRKGGVALVIDVDSIGTSNSSPLTPAGGTPKDSSLPSITSSEGVTAPSPLVDDQKRKERELQFLRRQSEKQQRDLEKRRKMTEQANQEGQERLLKESLAQEQKKQEAAARRERIMAQYLEKKRQKDLEEKGLASSHGQAVAKGVIGGGPQGFAFVATGDGASGKTGGTAKPATTKQRSKSTTADNNTVASGAKQPRSRKGSSSDKQQKQKLEGKNSGGGGGGMALSRSRKNSVENLLSDGESIVSTMDNWDARSEFSEYNGPKLFVKPSSKSNKQKIQNAITQSVFPGAVNSEMKNKILQQLDASCAGGGSSDVSESGAGKHFLVLFRDHSLKYRAIYLCEGDCSQGIITKIVGMGPTSVKLNMIQDLYKYDSGGKRFIQIPAKTMSVSVDAFTIHNQLWKKKSIAA